MTLELVLLIVTACIALMAIGALILLLAVPKPVKIAWFWLSVIERVLDIFSKRKKRRKRK